MLLDVTFTKAFTLTFSKMFNVMVIITLNLTFTKMFNLTFTRMFNVTFIKTFKRDNFTKSIYRFFVIRFRAYAKHLQNLNPAFIIYFMLDQRSMFLTCY